MTDPSPSDPVAFKREERFIVIKRKHLNAEAERMLRVRMVEIGAEPVECVVVKSDWPEYETVWKMIEARCTRTSLEATIARLSERAEGMREAHSGVPDEEGLRQLSLLYNHRPDDSAQFTRWQMVVAMAHGRRLAAELIRDHVFAEAHDTAWDEGFNYAKQQTLAALTAYEQSRLQPEQPK
jgi:hypothetical protein